MLHICDAGSLNAYTSGVSESDYLDLDLSTIDQDDGFSEDAFGADSENTCPSFGWRIPFITIAVNIPRIVPTSVPIGPVKKIPRSGPWFAFGVKMIGPKKPATKATPPMMRHPIEPNRAVRLSPTAASIRRIAALQKGHEKMKENQPPPRVQMKIANRSMRTAGTPNRTDVRSLFRFIIFLTDYLIAYD